MNQSSMTLTFCLDGRSPHEGHVATRKWPVVPPVGSTLSLRPTDEAWGGPGTAFPAHEAYEVVALEFCEVSDPEPMEAGVHVIVHVRRVGHRR